MDNPRMDFNFPIVAQVRKGEPKRPGKNKKGEDIMVVGPDLKDRMRIAFFPGTDVYRNLFIASHPELKDKDPKTLANIYVRRIRAMIPFAKVWDGLEVWNEVHQAGRMVVRANDKQVLFRKDPSTGKYLVRDGDPFEAFVPGQPITYERGGRVFSLATRTTTRLKLFLPDLGRMVMFELKSTGYYDSLYLKQQLGAIQMMANMLNNGVAGGIPFFVYRAEQMITWNKPDGTAQRVPHFCYQIEIDPEWVAAATKRMSNFALTGQQIAGLLAPTVELAGNEDPSLGHVDPEEGDEEHEANEAPVDAIDSPFRDEIQSHPPIDPPVVERKEEPAPENPLRAAQQIVAAAPHNGNALSRPMSPEVVRAALVVKADGFRSRPVTPKQTGLAAMLLEQVFSAQPEPKKIRYSVTNYLFGRESLSDIQPGELHALLEWLKPTKLESGEYIVDAMAAKEASNLFAAANKAAGQMEIPF
jgi:hypothetical protein